jgi:hypothetical protein
MACGVAIWRAGASAGAAAGRSDASGGGSTGGACTVGSDAGGAYEGAGGAAGTCSAARLSTMGRGSGARGAGARGAGFSFRRFGVTASRRGGGVGAGGGTTTTGGSSARTSADPVGADWLPALGGSTTGGATIPNDGNPLSPSATARSTLAKSDIATTHGLTRSWGVPTRSTRRAEAMSLRSPGPRPPAHSGMAARSGAEHAAVCRQLAPHSGQKWKCGPALAPGAGLPPVGKHHGHEAGSPSRHRPS